MIQHARRFRPVAIVFSATLLFVAPLRAQESAVADAPTLAARDSVIPAAAGPTTDAAAVAVRRPAAEARTAAPTPANHSQGQATALMIVGGAAVLTGLVIGGGAGYAISVGGAVVGLIGLYEYLQ